MATDERKRPLLSTMAGLTAVVMFLAAASPGLAGPAEEIDALENPGSDVWDAVVRRILISSYDQDGSRSLDRSEELLLIPCEIYALLDRKAQQSWGADLRTTYGSRSDKRWIGNVLGFSDSMRSGLDVLLLTCLAHGTEPVGLVDRILGMADGGSTLWDQAIRPLLLESFDADNSGWLDQPPEIQAIPCAVWAALDGGVRQRWAKGLRTIYGFGSTTLWVGNTLGFSEAVRGLADEGLTACLGTGPALPPPVGFPPPPPAPTAGSEGSPPEAIHSLGKPGTDSWDTGVKAILLEHFDSDSSGSLDTDAEATSLTCVDWRSMDEAVHNRFGYGLRPIYGFKQGYAWVGRVLGFSDVTRAAADADLASCEAKGWIEDEVGGPPQAGRVAAAIAAVPNGGTRAWDLRVRPALVRDFDADGSGAIDSAPEIGSIPCSVWNALDNSVRSTWNRSLRTMYGFEPEVQWAGDALGFAQDIRTLADSALTTCAPPRSRPTEGEPASSR